MMPAFQALGGELLAMALTGERVDVEMLTRVLEVHGVRMLERNFEPGFKAKLHKKDMRIAMEIIDELSMNLPGTKLATDGINEAVEAGLGEADTTSVVQIIEKRNGVRLGQV